MFFRNIFFYMVGIVFLALAKVKNIIKGYSKPKPFGIAEADRCIEYDIHIADEWLSYYREYTKNSTINDKNILELGPGSDLGIGIYLLAEGANRYDACDVNDLIKSTPDSFYERLFQKLESRNPQANFEIIRNELKDAKAGKPSRLNYVVRDDFDIVSAFGEGSIDVVFSNAAFEHFDDIESTFSQLSKVCKPGAILVAGIDLQTHSRWIREEDPNNIYRYPSYLYNRFWFRGIPNRVRPFQYKNALERCGWTDIIITPAKKCEDHNNSYSGLNKAFADIDNQMEYLTIMLCARKK
jgi:SAM-dependent methyltransferase